MIVREIRQELFHPDEIIIETNYLLSIMDNVRVDSLIINEVKTNCQQILLEINLRIFSLVHRLIGYDVYAEIYFKLSKKCLLVNSGTKRIDEEKPKI